MIAGCLPLFRLVNLKMVFCNPFSNISSSKPLENSEEDDCDFCIIEHTLRKDYLFIKLQELSDSTTSEQAEQALHDLESALRIKDTSIMRDLALAGCLGIIHHKLESPSKEERPSPLSAAPLLYKFARHGVGFKVNEERPGIMVCKRTNYFLRAR
jgi:hypothetical protein